MKRFALAACLVALTPFGASAQSADQLVKGATDTSNVLNYGMGYNLQRFSPLTQISRDNAKDLVPVWNYSFADDRSEESQPLVYQGVIYVTTHNATMAIDAKTGKQIWKSKIEYPAETPRQRDGGDCTKVHTGDGLVRASCEGPLAGKLSCRPVRVTVAHLTSSSPA